MNTNERTDAILTEAMSSLSQAAAMCDIYKMILDKIPKGEWFRCGDINLRCSCQLITGLMRRLKDAGFAERRVIDEGLKTITVRRLVVRDSNNEPHMIALYDRNGKYIDTIPNPKFDRTDEKCYSSYIDIQKTVKASHAEYRLTVSLD